MKKKFFLLILLHLTGIVITAQKLSSNSLFTINAGYKLKDIVRKGDALSISKIELDRIMTSRPTKLDLQIPFEGKILTLVLEGYPLVKYLSGDYFNT